MKARVRVRIKVRVRVGVEVGVTDKVGVRVGVGIRVRVTLGLRLGLESVMEAQHDDEENARVGEVEEHHPILSLPIEARREDAGSDHEDVRPRE